MTSALGAAFRAATEATVSAAGRGALAGPVAAGEPPAIGAGNDAEPALAGALADVEGFLLIAGTGSIAFARSSAGERARSGGWGHFLGDEGSAFWIAFEAIKRGIRSSEGRDRPSRLLDAATKHFGLDNAQALIPLTYWNSTRPGSRRSRPSWPGPRKRATRSPLR
jgi:N-acetylglucosamine kinase-like BadF-type ATPase